MDRRRLLLRGRLYLFHPALRRGARKVPRRLLTPTLSLSLTLTLTRTLTPTLTPTLTRAPTLTLTLSPTLTRYLGSEQLVSLLQAIFALLFVGFRTLYWPCVSYHFWADSVAALRGEAGADVPAVHSGAAFGLFLVANLGLTGLQLLWTSKIFKALLGGEKNSSSSKPTKKA